MAVVVAREGTEAQGTDLIPEWLNHFIQYPLRLDALDLTEGGKMDKIHKLKMDYGNHIVMVCGRFRDDYHYLKFNKVWTGVTCKNCLKKKERP